MRQYYIKVHKNVINTDHGIEFYEGFYLISYLETLCE